MSSLIKDVETTKGSQLNQLQTKADAKVTKRKLAIEFVSDDLEALVKDIEMSKAGQSNQLQYKDDAIDEKRVERKRKRDILYARKESAIVYVSSEDDEDILKSSILLEKDDEANFKSLIPLEKDDEKVKNLLRVRVRIGGYAPTTQLVRTESGPLQEAIDALQGPSPLKKKKEDQESEEEDLDKTQEKPEEKDEEEKEEELQVTSSLCHHQKHEFQSAQDPDAWIMNPEMYYFATFGVDESKDQ
jgi:hypothetical protein